ncbi:MAG: hypothetical protein WBB64_00650 [Anaerolineales bacterium]
MSYKKQLGVLLMVVFLLLSACSSNSSELTDNPDTETEQSEEGLNDGKVELTEDYADDALSVRMQLVVGSLLLENTDLAADSVMAEKLLPYWKMYKVLAESDTKAQEEMDAVIGQIQDTMTADQLSYIVDLQITQETMLTLVSDLGINEKFISEGMKEGAGTGFDRPEGFVPGSGRGGGQDGNIDPELMATKQAAREDAGDGMMSRLTIPLVDELISLLEEKAGS